MNTDFKVGEQVVWETFSGAGTRTREGAVCKIIQPGQSVKAAFDAAKAPGVRCEYGGAGKATEVRYLIRAEKDGRPTLYCPPTRRLRSAGATAAAAGTPAAGQETGTGEAPTGDEDAD